MRPLMHQAYAEVPRPGLFSQFCVVAIIVCLLWPPDLQSYRPGSVPDDLALASDHYARFGSALAEVAVPLLSRDPVGLVQAIYVALATTAATHGLKRLLDTWVVWGTRLGERPSGPQSRYNMPSGHSSMASSALYFVTRRYGWLHALYLVPLLLLTMYGRVALNAHTVAAVVAGALVGFLMAALFTSRRTAHAMPVKPREPESSGGALVPAEVRSSVVNILLVEDHAALSGMLTEHLQTRGFVVDMVPTGREALTAISMKRYDAVIIDLGLPDMDGMEVLKNLRLTTQSQTPALILTARDGLHDRVRGLNAGADDYVIKPFDVIELEARLKAVLRRPGPRASDTVCAGNIAVHLSSREAFVMSVPIDLSKREWVLLVELLRARDRVVIKDLLEERLYAAHEPVTPNAVEAVVSRLRKKLAGAGADRTIEPRRGIGYCLRPVSA